jgi:hypothetical protein
LTSRKTVLNSGQMTTHKPPWCPPLVEMASGTIGHLLAWEMHERQHLVGVDLLGYSKAATAPYTRSCPCKRVACAPWTIPSPTRLFPAASSASMALSGLGPVSRAEPSRPSMTAGRRVIPRGATGDPVSNSSAEYGPIRSASSTRPGGERQSQFLAGKPSPRCASWCTRPAGRFPPPATQTPTAPTSRSSGALPTLHDQGP